MPEHPLSADVMPSIRSLLLPKKCFVGMLDAEAGGQELMPGRVERLGTLPMMLFTQFTRS